MAKKWTLKEVAETIWEGTDTDAVIEACKRFPMTCIAIARSRKEDVEKFLNGIPDYVTPLGFERQLKGVSSDGPEAEAEEEEAMNPPEETEVPAEEDPKERKRRVDRERQQRKRAKDKDIKESEETAGEEQPESGKYDEIGAVELFKMCKARGLAVQPKKPQRFYIDLLEADDAEKEKAAQKAAEEPEEDDIDWEDEEDVDGEQEAAEMNADEAEHEERMAEEKKAKKSSSTKKSTSKKKAPEPEPEEDDDEDDWNI